MLEFRNVTYTKDGRTILDNLSFPLAKGRFTVLLGRNGSGKTTLLRAINRELAYRGEILIDGTPTDRLPPRERALRVSLLPQALQYFFFLSRQKHPTTIL